MSKLEYILLMAIVGFYGLLFVSLIYRAIMNLWIGHRASDLPELKKTTFARATSSGRAWTRSVWRGSLAHDALKKLNDYQSSGTGKIPAIPRSF